MDDSTAAGLQRPMGLAAQMRCIAASYLRRLKRRSLRGTSCVQNGANVVPSGIHALPRSDASEPGVRLHLGCGEVYLEGYVNVDFPSADHTVQTTTTADLVADITTLSYAPESVDEIRLHHVFEHFDRVTALRLLADWHRWLKRGGRLVIETPDFEKCVQTWIASKDERARCKIVRHLFGSQEAHWALHCDGWYESKFKLVLKQLNYRHVETQRNHWQGTYNITVVACKNATTPEIETQQAAIRELLRMYLVDDSASEQKMLRVWLGSDHAAPAAA